MPKFLTALAPVMLLLSGGWSAYCADIYVQTNLVSDIPGMAAFTDANMQNPWGISFSATSPAWVSNTGSNTSTLYTATGAPNPLVVSVAGGPTGQVNIPGTLPSSDFPVNGTSNATRASFVFDTLGGTILAWNGGASATVQATKAGAAYTGLAINSVSGAPYIYAANFAQGTIDVFDSSWAPATLTGHFTDPNLPAGYTPYNIQTINGNLYVAYAQAGTGPMTPTRGAGLGIVDVYAPDGTFLSRVVTGGQLNAPWGLTLAPAGFGAFAGDLLVGNFGNGQINAYTTSGTFVGTIDGPNGSPIVIPNLWAVAVRTGGGFDTNGIYFTAGINAQRDGLYGTIDPAPEPGTLTTLGLASAVAGITVFVRRPRVS